MAPSWPPSSGQTLDHPPSSPPSSDLHHTSASPRTHTSSMMPAQEETAYIAGASALESNKPAQAGFPFLSLPPEIRNMIYHYIFTPVRDGKCLAIHAPWDAHRLQGFRRECSLCRLNIEHDTCFARFNHEQHLSYAFELPHNHVQSGILRTCRTVMREASPVSLAHMHISMHLSSHDSDFSLRCLKRLLAYMRQPGGAYLSRLTYTCYTLTAETMRLLIQITNRGNISIGYLVLITSSSVNHPDAAKLFVATLDSLEHKPARVEWLYRYTRLPDEYNNDRKEFNEAARKWLVQSAKIKVTDCNAALPLLQDLLPQYFDQSSDSSD
ncbi:uncharacterized protein M437DRAFT_66332 [Aureobasidium melanogenum CBS 110374]|uniref:Uncharacterized protein n=1 Tax=Aureobasidium melanogenum (strain CBS 110374) TaxID=1043003 RepID=A0A074WJ35_AURM1|nr:uncharacterized protein M437DRAFT_66332 [Aureobasidium melanogenum CBS 110374]KEQ62461.1 hypothetical protein M437DRAFT_66332 [Aureobasidium melanogenum CBS 110374]